MRRLRLEHPVIWFFVLACLLTGVGQCVHFAVSRHLAAGVPAGTPIEDTPIMTWVRYAPFVTGTGPSLAGLIMTALLYGVPGLRRLVRRLSPWPAARAWPVLAACLVVPVVLIVIPLAMMSTLEVSASPPAWSLSSYLAGAVLGSGFAGPGVFEELGWRGFALPHLQRQHSALVSSLVVGIVWAFWHLPNFVIPSERPPWWYLFVFVALLMALSVLFTWVYNSTGGSLFAVIVLHGAIDAALQLRTTADSSVMAREDLVVLLLFAITAVVLVRRWGAANLSDRDRVVAESPPDASEPLTA